MNEQIWKKIFINLFVQAACGNSVFFLLSSYFAWLNNNMLLASHDGDMDCQAFSFLFTVMPKDGAFGLWLHSIVIKFSLMKALTCTKCFSTLISITSELSKETKIISTWTLELKLFISDCFLLMLITQCLIFENAASISYKKPHCVKWFPCLIPKLMGFLKTQFNPCCRAGDMDWRAFSSFCLCSKGHVCLWLGSINISCNEKL